MSRDGVVITDRENGGDVASSRFTEKLKDHKINNNNFVNLEHVSMNDWLSAGTIVAITALIYTIARDILERKKAQALAISCWLDGSIPSEMEDDNEISVIISNPSSQPIYDVVIALDIVDDKKARHQFNLMYDSARYIVCVPPGNYYTFIPWNGQGMHTVFNTAISFRDARGKWWNRDAAGRIEESYNSLDRYHVMRPPDPQSIYELKSN